MTSDSFEWVERIQNAILDLEEKPQFGSPSEFPLKAFVSALRQKLGKNSLNLEVSDMRWLLQEDIFQGLGENPELFAIGFSPLRPAIVWGMSKDNAKSLLAAFLEVEDEKAILLEEEIYKAFNEFLILEALELFDQTGFAQGLTPHLLSLDKHSLAEALSHSYRIDISIRLLGRSMWGFIIIPEGFRDEWKRYFEVKTPESLEPSVAKKITLDVALEVGNTELSLQEWQGAKPGDFIVLDHCYYDPEIKSGRLILKVNGHAIFRGKIKEEGIKILEYPLYEMKGGMMEKEFDEEEDLDLFSDLDDLDDEDGEDLSEDEDLNETEDESIGQEELFSIDQDKKTENEKESPLTPENIPLQITIEVGRVQMTALELMNLQPGNLIEMNVTPEKGVDLVLNGRKIGRGELIKMGEVLGVRILKL